MPAVRLRVKSSKGVGRSLAAGRTLLVIGRLMPNYRRYFVPGGTYFFTLVTHQRMPYLTKKLARSHLRAAIDHERRRRPFEIVAWVLLPDHMHAIWTLPRGDDEYSLRWKRIKERFSKSFLAAGGFESIRSASRVKRKERGIWQRRFWEHTIQDEQDFDRHFDYVHYNPVKHGYVNRSIDWPYSTFHRWANAGVYPADWGRGRLCFDDLDETAME